ncbi:MAG: hypothetical protein K8S54_04385 [Spirochaetia bacterium]|nr:hypothetical protein [Spirochaetia bacterium]
MVAYYKFLILTLAVSAPLFSQDQAFSAAELKAHSGGSSCWIQVRQSVYDITTYLVEHANQHEYDLRKWCGQDASAGWLDKDGKNKSHSRKAETLLKKYRIGSIKANP